jgi:ribA/ribD-fused uncharacterized protein
MSLDVIDRFTNAWGFLSNFFPAVIVFQGVTYRTSEHFFNAHKTVDPAKRGKIVAAATPAEAKRLGGPPARGGIVDDLRPDWDEVFRYHAMQTALELKFGQHPMLARLLQETGDVRLIEGNTWHDTHWGVCICHQHGGRGDNHLGRMLMELRESIRQERG